MNVKLNIIDGSHIAFYYCSPEHLAINMLSYIKEGREKKQEIYTYIHPEVLEVLKKIAKDLNCDYDMQHIHLENMINTYGRYGSEGLKDKIYAMINQSKQRGNKGIRAIIQADYAIIKTSKDSFLKFEHTITNLISNTVFSLMCTYDFLDFISNKKVIDDEIIIKSFKIHPYILNKFSIKHNKYYAYMH